MTNSSPGNRIERAARRSSQNATCFSRFGNLPEVCFQPLSMKEIKFGGAAESCPCVACFLPGSSRSKVFTETRIARLDAAVIVPNKGRENSPPESGGVGHQETARRRWFRSEPFTHAALEPPPAGSASRSRCPPDSGGQYARFRIFDFIDNQH